MTEERPQIPEVGIIALSGDTWCDQWQSRHHVLTRLAKYYQVVWVNPPYQVNELAKLRGWPKRRAGSLDQSFPGVRVYNPEPWLPAVFRPKWFADMTFRLRLSKARDLLVRNGVKKVILYIWRPEFHRALDNIEYDLSCYHIDDEYSFSSVETAISGEELHLLKNVDRVFIHSPGLLEKKGQFNPRTSFVPNGVDYELHSRAQEEPKDLRRIPHPRIGYTGWLKRQLDWELILELARRHPQWSFVFAGGQHPHEDILRPIADLKQLSNVHFLGARSSSELALYPQHFDVCIMPYVHDAYTQYIYPLKLHEYLAGGQPVVGTPIRSLLDFSDSVYLASNANEWTTEITVALSPAARSSESRARRQLVARQNDWQIQTARIACIFAEDLGLDVPWKLQQTASVAH